MTPSKRLDAVFTALADPTRRAILARLANDEGSVLELAKLFAMSQPAISKHLKVLDASAPAGARCPAPALPHRRQAARRSATG